MIKVFQLQSTDLAQVGLQFIQRFSLRVCAGKTRDVAHQQAGDGVAFYHSDVGVRGFTEIHF